MVRVLPGPLRPAHLLGIALLAALATDLSLLIRPANYLGGSSDEQRYLEAALDWIVHGPHAGTTHWALRHPLVLAVVGSFRSFGISIATLQLPSRLAFDLTAGLTAAMLARWFGRRTALCWTLVAILVPILHRNATNCGPETIELLLVVTAGWSLWEARDGRRGLAVFAGLCFGLAVLTRETTVFLLALVALAMWRRHLAGRLAPWFVLGLLLPVALDIGWLWWMTGDPLYRAHVDQSHTHIFSADLKGGVYAGRVLLNPDLASRWSATGPTDLWWPINPLVDLLIAPGFGMVFLAWALLALLPATRLTGASARLQPWLLATVAGGYLWVIWVLTLSPQPRYQLAAVYAATIAAALHLARPAVTPSARWAKRFAWVLIALGGGLAILLSPDRQTNARLLGSWLAAHPGAVLHLPAEDARRLSFPLILAGHRDQISAAPTPVGGLYARELSKAGLTGRKQVVGRITGHRVFPYINPPRQFEIERRLP